LWQAVFADSCAGKPACYAGASAALSATPELVMVGTLDGKLRALSADDGTTLWEFDTWGSFPAINGGKATGASIDVHGPLLAGRQLFISSGYDVFDQGGGNALMMFELATPVEPAAAPAVLSCEPLLVDGERPQLCTMDFRPVCGHLAAGARRTYSNACSACSQPAVDSYTDGECIETE
jgi:hypothetical protein